MALREAEILARHTDLRTTEHYNCDRRDLDRHGGHFLAAYGAVCEPFRVDSPARLR